MAAEGGNTIRSAGAWSLGSKKQFERSKRKKHYKDNLVGEADEDVFSTSLDLSFHWLIKGKPLSRLL